MLTSFKEIWAQGESVTIHWQKQTYYNLFLSTDYPIHLLKTNNQPAFRE